MAAQKKGLGRGLDALLDPYDVSFEEKKDAGRGILTVGIRTIDTNALQPRKQFDEDSLKELADSIRVHGIVQPLIVKKKKDRYFIIAGERRFRAARLAGLTEVPVLVADYDEAQIHEVSLIENIQREDLNPIEEAAAIRFLMKQHDMTQEEVAARLGKSRSAIANAVRLLQLPEQIIDMLKTGVLSAGHGRALAGLADETQLLQLAEECVKNGYSVRTMEERIRQLNEKKKPVVRKEKKPLSADLQNIQDAFRESLGTKVTLSGNDSRGKVTIEYYSKEDLERVYEMILSKENEK